MFELKFAAEVSDLTGTWAVGVLALVYGQYYSGITLPALAEESGPGISSQLFPRWMTKPLSSPCLKTMAYRQFIVGTFIWVLRVEIGIHPAHRIQYR